METKKGESHTEKNLRSNAENILRNSLQFCIPKTKVQIGIFFEEQKHLKRLKKTHFTDYCNDEAILQQTKEFVWIDTQTKGADALFSFQVHEAPYLARWYYEYEIYAIFKKQFRITRKSFTGAFQYWVEKPDKQQTNFIFFQKFNLYFDLSVNKQSISITIAYDGISKVLLKHVEELVNQHNLDTTLLKSVVYEKECKPYLHVPDEFRLQPNKVYPILRRALAEQLEIEWKNPRDKHKVNTAFKQINEFYENYMVADNVKELFRTKLQWTRVAAGEIATLKESDKMLAFGNNHKAENIYQAFGKYGPYRLPAALHFKVFLIYPQGLSASKQILEKHLSGEAGFTNLKSYSHLPLVYCPTLNLEIQDVQEIESEVKRHMKTFEKEDGVQYFAFYISPYPKYGISPKQQQHYYRIKELLLKRRIVSQVIVGSGMSKNINFWIPNIALSMVAKMGGIPWKLARETDKELIVGFGAFRSHQHKKPYVGSSFCFDNEGHFQEFDCWQEVYEWAFIGQLYKAILNYKAKNKGIQRIVIHYYKELNKKEFRQVEELIDKFSLDIPVIVVRINSTFRHKELIVDASHKYHLPMNATYYHLQYHDYLLYINEREGEEMQEVKKAGYPLKVSLQSNRAGLFEDKVLVQHLMQQLYDFSLLHWRSINQPRLPVTIAYPQYLARIFPHFKAEVLQDIGRTSLWFL